jgi:flagellar protein FliS
MYRDAYLETEILCASPVRLVELLYRGAIDAVRAAAAAVDGGRIEERNRQINRAQAILCELSLSLNHQAGGTLSRDLVELYDYMQRRLNEANSLQTRTPLDEVKHLLETLVGAWSSAAADASIAVGAAEVSANQLASQFGGIDLEGAGLDRLG